MPNYFTELKDGPSGPSYKVKDEEAEQAIGAIGTALGNKVDKEAGKGLSTNDYSDTEKGKVEANAEAIEAMVNVYGSKNLLPTVRSGSSNGAIFTVNADGSLTITGNPTKYTSFTVYNNLNLPAGQYILSGIPSGGGVDKWGINCQVDGTWLPNSVWQGGATSYIINVSSIINQVTFIVYPKTDGGYNLTFYPMIRDARIADSTYVPYAMTNRKLTEKQPVFKFITITPSDTAEHYEYINHPDARTPKYIIAQSIAPMENASVSLKLWWQTFETGQSQSLLRYVATSATYTYTVALCYFY